MQNPSNPENLQMDATTITITVPKPSSWEQYTMDIINQILQLANKPWRFEQVLNESGQRFTYARNIDNDHVLYVERDKACHLKADRLKSL